MPALPSPILINGNGVGPRQWTTQGFTAVDEGISAADGQIIRGASPGGSENRGTDLDTSFTLTDMPSDFGTMADLSWQVRYQADNATGDDTLTLGIRIVNGALILAAADSGGTFQTVRTGLNSTWPTTQTNSPVTAFTYVNTTASRATWNGAEVELRSTHSQDMGPDDNTCIVDTLQFTGNYNLGFQLSQSHFRGRNDDGSESAATWIAATNTNFSITNDTIFRLRFGLTEVNAVAGGNRTIKIQHRINDQGAWVDTATTGSNVRLTTSGFVSNDTQTTQQVTSGTFWSGATTLSKFRSSSGTIAATSSFPASNRSEQEFSLIFVNGDMFEGDFADFRIQYTSGTETITQTQIPRVTQVGGGGPSGGGILNLMASL